MDPEKNNNSNYIASLKNVAIISHSQLASQALHGSTYVLKPYLAPVRFSGFCHSTDVVSLFWVVMH